mmetsp:Transcript_6263/g.15579  ORF Transcript_6263/g.15579 Transcript_6263/m.15579 type:complete len:232 (-) Transcript_6263:562-1257(-)
MRGLLCSEASNLLPTLRGTLIRPRRCIHRSHVACHFPILPGTDPLMTSCTSLYRVAYRASTVPRTRSRRDTSACHCRPPRPLSTVPGTSRLLRTSKSHILLSCFASNCLHRYHLCFQSSRDPPSRRISNDRHTQSHQNTHTSLVHAARRPSSCRGTCKFQKDEKCRSRGVYRLSTDLHNRCPRPQNKISLSICFRLETVPDKSFCPCRSNAHCPRVCHRPTRPHKRRRAQT